MSEVALRPSGLQALDMVRRLEAETLKRPQPAIETTHVLHAGMYFRTVRIPANRYIVGALIKVATVLTVCGHVRVFTGEDAIVLEGYNVLPAAAGRKSAFAAISETYLTMAFPTSATSVDQAEREFTDEFEALLSRKEGLCPE